MSQAVLNDKIAQAHVHSMLAIDLTAACHLLSILYAFIPRSKVFS